MWKTFVFYAALLFGLVNQVEPARSDDAYNACMSDALNKFAAGDCGRALEDRSRARLDKAWQEFTKETNPAVVAAIGEGQSDWEAYLESACEFYRKNNLGMVVDYLRAGYWQCRSQILLERAAYLDRIAELYLINR